jgi:hypothetical protein
MWYFYEHGRHDLLRDQPLAHLEIQIGGHRFAQTAQFLANLAEGRFS